MAGIGWAPLGGEWWTWQWCLRSGARQQVGLVSSGLPVRSSSSGGGCQHCWMAGLCLCCAGCQVSLGGNGPPTLLSHPSLCPLPCCRLGWESLFFAAFFVAAWAALSAVRHQRR
jgi:hypothetical protein